MSAQGLAIAAAVREDLRRCRRALEAIEVSVAAIRPDDLELSSTSSARPASALAAALVSYLAQGGKLEPDLALDLSHELAAMRARRHAPPPPPAA